jgi:hypothetical protein
MCYRFRERAIGHLIRTTDTFTWEDLPSRDPVTGHITKAGHISITQTIAKYIPVLVYVVHITQMTANVVTSGGMLLPAWFPFDVSVSPVYEIANIVQVI